MEDLWEGGISFVQMNMDTSVVLVISSRLNLLLIELLPLRQIVIPPPIVSMACRQMCMYMRMCLFSCMQVLFV